MSEIMDIPKPTLTVILSNLMRAGILQSKEGVNGGVRMAKSEEKITLYDLLIAIESERPLFQTDYAINASGERPENAQKSVNSILKNIESSIKEDMKKVTLREILDTM
jgi:Rrf2 family protein